MTSKEALENIKKAPSFMGGNPRYWTDLNSSIPFLEDINIIEQDLERLEKLEYVMLLLLDYQLINFDELEEFMDDEELEAMKKAFKEIEDKIKRSSYEE